MLAFFGMSRLWLGREAVLLDLHSTKDRFALVLEQNDAAFDSDQVAGFRRERNGLRVGARVGVAVR